LRWASDSAIAASVVAGAGKGLNPQRRAHIQIARSWANSMLFVGKISLSNDTHRHL
jgi:hypothetical protein